MSTKPSDSASAPPSLRRLIHRTTLFSAWLPLLSAEFLLLAAFIGMGFFAAIRTRDRLLSEARLIMQETSKREAALISQRGKEISTLCGLLQGAQRDFFTGLRAGEGFHGDDPDHFAVSDSGAFYKRVDDGGASLYYSAGRMTGPFERRKALESRVNDPLLKRIVETSDLVVAAYLNTHDGMCRYYPFIEDQPSVFPPALDVEHFVFYSAAMPENDPGLGPVWTPAYQDPAGQGWILSCVAPVIVEGELEGVVGLDLPLARLVAGLLDEPHPFDALAMLVREDGHSVAMPDTLARLLGCPTGADDPYPLPLVELVMHAGQHDMLESTGPGAELMKQAWRANGEARLGIIGEREIMVAITAVPGMQLRLASFVDAGQLLAPARSFERLTRQSGLWLFALMALLNLGFLAWMSRRSARVARRIAGPVIDLNAATSRFVEHFEHTHLRPSSILELEQLRQNFQRMIRQRIDDHSQITRLNLAYSRFVPSSFIARLGRSSVIDACLGDHVVRDTAVLVFGMSLQEGPESVEVLEARLRRFNELLLWIGPEIRRHGGFVERIRGGTLRALFDDPVAALSACAELVRSSPVDARTDADPSTCREDLNLVLHFGSVLLGTAGEPGRLGSLVLGEAVDLAERLLRLGRHTGSRLLVTRSALATSPSFGLLLRRVERVRLAGSASTLAEDVYQGFPPDAEDGALARSMPGFETALAAWEAGEFEAARIGFAACLDSVPGDDMARHHLLRCERMRGAILPADWDGVTVLLDDRRISARNG